MAADSVLGPVEIADLKVRRRCSATTEASGTEVRAPRIGGCSAGSCAQVMEVTRSIAARPVPMGALTPRHGEPTSVDGSSITSMTRLELGGYCGRGAGLGYSHRLVTATSTPTATERPGPDPARPLMDHRPWAQSVNA